MTSARRVDALPGIPTVGEVVAGYQVIGLLGVGAPKKTPAEVIGRLNKEINGILSDTRIRGRLADLGATILPLTPAGFGKLIADETGKWAKVVKFSGARPD